MSRRNFSGWVIIALTLSWWGVACAKPVISHPAEVFDPGDVTAPTYQSSTIASNGTTVTVNFDETVVATSSDGFTFTPSGGAATLTYASGTGTASLVFTSSRVIYDSETATIAYSSTTGDVADVSANDLATFGATSVTNNSTQSEVTGDEPIIAPIAAQLIADEGSISFTPTLSQGTGVTYTASNLPTGAAINSGTGAVTGTLSTLGAWRTKITATNSAGEDSVWVPISVYSSTANISQASGFPYNCSTANRKYTLTENITVDGGGIAITASNVSIDFAGFTLTYCNATPIAITNNGFETGTGAAATGWDLTAAPNAERYDGDFLDNEIFAGSYSLRFDIINGTETAVCDDTITLEADTTYTASMMAFYGNVNEPTGTGTSSPNSASVTMELDNGVDTPITVTRSTTTSRGQQLCETVFTTGATDLTYTVSVRTTHTAAVANRYWFVDDLKVLPTKAYGVTTQIYNWSAANYIAFPFDVDASGTNAILTNGAIVQGEEGSWSHGVYLHQITGVAIDNVDISVIGQNSSCVEGNTQQNRVCYVQRSTLDSTIPALTSRDNYHGTMVHAVSGIIKDNTLTNGPHAGITCSDGSADSVIAGNTLTLKSRYTNAFGIMLSSEATSTGGMIYRNTVTTSDDNCQGPGIFMSGDVACEMWGNTISVQQAANNQEYGGDQQSGVYGIQIESGANKSVHDNTVTVYSSVAEAHAFRMGGGALVPSNNAIYDNTFTAVRESGSFHCNTMKLGTADVGFELTDAAGNSIYGNTFVSNGSFVGYSCTIDDFTIGSNTWQVTGNASVFDVLDVFDYINPGDTTLSVTNLRFVDPIYFDAGTRTEFEDATIVYYGDQSTDYDSDFSVQWTITVQVNNASAEPVAGATVTIDNVSAVEVFSGTTNASGQVEAVISEFKTNGDTTVDYNDHSVTVTSGMLGGSASFTADAAKTVTVEVN